MNNFNWTKAFGFGALIWVIMFAAAAILVSLNVVLSVWTMLALAVIAGVLSYSFAISANPQTAGEALGYGVLWAALGIVLDLLISRQFNVGSGIFGVWTYWLGYALMLFVPSLRVPSEVGTGAQHHPI
ncbi:MAG: hypothetical protein A2751_02000 [Candidatus Doudnabacteria bacterium RIFCSPHIGHO2_01_FULL_46_14]|uniref:Uncharacterized protein n=1 Tax=Candidatus Doudnabacteria bacterium RIFCSPHIGHO2_01_FULL_46_14 TaxID=1817824 RepID=A0A1F5NJI2_9BACT|nr:MAG: hypothetical protein A2751_02000 [Candidatus Doudnabacteria bacterium RIFCSPHIGHO2_01_FULL_46_14]